MFGRFSVVVAYSVRQRRQEIAIRIAHGATRGDILRMVLHGGSIMSAIGVAVGIGGALARGSDGGLAPRMMGSDLESHDR
jgi:ABC-type lipoprotein release transport system permease subunit